MRLSRHLPLGPALVAACWAAVAPWALPVPALAAAPAAPATPATPAVGSPEWIVHQFFQQKEFPELSRYATGEFAELYKNSPTLGSIVPSGVTVSTRVLERDAQRIVFGVSMTDSNVTKEWYAYLRLEGGTFKLE